MVLSLIVELGKTGSFDEALMQLSYLDELAKRAPHKPGRVHLVLSGFTNDYFMTIFVPNSNFKPFE